MILLQFTYNLFLLLQMVAIFFFSAKKPDGLRGWTSFLSSSLSNGRYVYYYDYFFYLFNFYYCSAHILTIMRPALRGILTYIRW